MHVVSIIYGQTTPTTGFINKYTRISPRAYSNITLYIWDKALVGMVYYIPFSGNISRKKNFAKTSTHVLHENFAGFYFRQCGKGHHVHCAIINTQEKNYR